MRSLNVRFLHEYRDHYYTRHQTPEDCSLEIIPTASAFVLIASLVTILGGFQLQRYVAFKAAAKTFRSNVLRIFEGLYPEPRNWPHDGTAVNNKLHTVFPELQSVVSDFKGCLPDSQKPKFEMAWQIYLHGSEGNAGTHYYQYMGYSSPDHPTPDSKETFKTNVERLLSYAKET